MTIKWSPEAVGDLNELRAYIAEDDSKAARRMVLHIVDTVESMIPNNPHIGRSGRVPGTRELVIPRTPFIVPYRFAAGAIEVLRVYHGARRWPERF